MKMHQGPRGDTHLTVTHRYLTEQGYDNPCDKAQAANWTLGTNVKTIEELSSEQLSELVYKMINGVK